MQEKKIAMLRYERTGAARCSAIALRAIRARAPAASTRPPTVQKIHAGKKEPKMLYSGAWEQPTNVNGTVRDKAPSTGNEGVGRRSRSVDSVFISGRPHRCRFSPPSCLPPRLYGPSIGRSLDSLSLTFSIRPQSQGANL